MGEPDYRQQIIDEGCQIEAALAKHGYDAKNFAQESSVERIIDALEACEGAGRDVQKLLDDERAKSKTLRAELRYLRHTLKSGAPLPDRQKLQDRTLGYLRERARRETPTAKRQELAKAMGCSAVVLDYVLRELLRTGSVRRVGRGVYQATEAAP
jgi:hypothetical protein